MKYFDENRLKDIFTELVNQNIINFFSFKNQTFICASDIEHAMEVIYPCCYDCNELRYDDFVFIVNNDLRNDLINIIIMCDFQFKSLQQGVIIKNQSAIINDVIHDFEFMEIN